MRLLVVVNPHSGRGEARRWKGVVGGFLERHGADAELVETETAEQATKFAGEAAARGYSTVAALGGDGTLHHVLTGAFGTGVALGFLPAGHGNDLAEGLGLPRDPLAAAEVMLRTPARPVDVLRVKFYAGAERVYLGAGGLGLDAEAAVLANTRFRRWPGTLRYVAAALQSLRTFQPAEIEVEVSPGEAGAPATRWSGEVLFAAVANASAYGAGIRIAPEARMDDGLLDVALITPMPLLDLLERLAEALAGGRVRSSNIVRFRGERVRIASRRELRFHGDGELLGSVRPGEPAEIEVIRGGVRIHAP